ncbi:MAG: hypothetical protein HYZ11_10790 [Candidatus Tectomicrobia bacterium]|uniref:Uncharacterized protein n=1 Tax=Tectimicrobiota bacterium TaxID=2528274 RepID=A0A932MMW8_UNCTE|nr:hypothetical protein [Candidatus Tectomicrobia bacterium]
MKEQLFTQVASRTLNRLTKDLQKKFELKKGDRFNVKGITYEIGPPRFQKDGIQFEISSKIPGEEFPPAYEHANYFKEIEKACRSSSKKPEAADMENIVRETRDQERKERDYVKLTYLYALNELYDDREVSTQVQEYAKNPEKAKELPPPMPGVNTLAGRIILNRLEAALYDAARRNVDTLIKANEDVREGLKKLRKG